MPSCERGLSTAPAGGAAGEAARATGAAWAAGADGAAGATGAGGAAAACSGAFAAAPFARRVTTRSPVLTLPPLRVCTCSTTPAAVEGTSMVALSDSSVRSGVSSSTLSPGFTSTSMTATSLKLPISGTCTSVTAAALTTNVAPSDLPGNWLVRIDAERLDRTADRGPVDPAVVGQRLERSHHDVAAIHLEKAAQRRARVRASIAVGAERHIASRHPLTDLVRHGAHVVSRRHDRSLATLQHLAHVRHTGVLVRMQQIPALAL